MAQLETTLKSDLGEKKTLQDALVREREQYAKLEAEFQDLQAKYFTLKESSEGQEEKLRYFAGENSVEAKDLEEALLMLRDGDNIHTFFCRIYFTLQSGVSYMLQGFLTSFHASCEGLPGQ